MLKCKTMSKYYGSEEYYCPCCGHAHHFLSGIGKKHIKHTMKEIKSIALLKYGVY